MLVDIGDIGVSDIGESNVGVCEELGEGIEDEVEENIREKTKQYMPATLLYNEQKAGLFDGLLKSNDENN